MNTKDFAARILNVLPNVNIAFSRDNVAAAIETYDILDALASGELLIVPAAKDVPETTAPETIDG